jgi:hypothetical protein
LRGGCGGEGEKGSGGKQTEIHGAPQKDRATVTSQFYAAIPAARLPERVTQRDAPLFHSVE